MNSLVNSATNTETIKRIEKLTPDSKPLWGTMSVSKMVKHLNIALQNALGELKFERSEMRKKFSEMAKPMILNNEPFGKSMPSDENFILKDEPDFLIERTKLIESVKEFSQSYTEKGKEATSSSEHPFFGELTSEEWDQLMWKHLDHHLRQFGV
ncbi:hypothetical protein BH10BAC5_BH10BAC5_07140 [soil metagenome]